VVAGLVTPESIVNPDKMLENAGINLVLGRVERIDASGKKVLLSGGEEIPYGKLVLGTGAVPVVPPLEGRELEGVFTLRSLSDAEKIRKHLVEKRAKKLVFVGAGFISLETATLLMSSDPNVEVTVVELLDHSLPLMLDAEMAAKVDEYLAGKGLDLRFNRRVARILERDGAARGVQLDSGESIEADAVFLNVGAKPSLELARSAGLRIGECGIKVNRFLETSDPDILAGGDSIENISFITKKPVPIQLRGPAVIQGRLIAKRIAGYEIDFPGLLGNSAVKLFDKSIAATGLTEGQAHREGHRTVCAAVDSRSKHGMIPGVRPWSIKLVFDGETARLIGGQIVSDAEAPAKEIDTVNALILGEKTISDLTVLINAGNPDCSSEPSAEPMTIAAEQALQKLRNGPRDST
jgi:NADPH-dependent 2,4-dienoyl-CoA reductase/sulfur reductase-like enzyme